MAVRYLEIYYIRYLCQGPVTDVDVTSFTLLFQRACVRKVSSCKLQKTIAFVKQRLAEKKNFFLQPWIFTLSSSASATTPAHQLTYTTHIDRYRPTDKKSYIVTALLTYLIIYLISSNWYYFVQHCFFTVLDRCKNFWYCPSLDWTTYLVDD